MVARLEIIFGQMLKDPSFHDLRTTFLQMPKDFGFDLRIKNLIETCPFWIESVWLYKSLTLMS
jgi:hypothetical protein